MHILLAAKNSFAVVWREHSLSSSDNVACSSAVLWSNKFPPTGVLYCFKFCALYICMHSATYLSIDNSTVPLSLNYIPMPMKVWCLPCLTFILPKCFPTHLYYQINYCGVLMRHLSIIYVPAYGTFFAFDCLVGHTWVIL